MNSKLNFVIDTIFIACVPAVAIYVNTIFTNYTVAYVISAIIAVLLTIIIKSICSEISLRTDRLIGTWYEKVDNEKMPFAICEFKYDSKNKSIRLWGKHYGVIGDKDDNNGNDGNNNDDKNDIPPLDIHNVVTFRSASLNYIKDESVSYTNTSRTKNHISPKTGIGVYEFDKDENGFTILEGFFADTVDDKAKLTPSTMYKADKAFKNRLNRENKAEPNKVESNKIEELWENFHKYINSNK